MGAGAAVGIDAQFVSRELELLQSIRAGTAVEHHLEPAYFDALSLATQASTGAEMLPVIAALPASTEDVERAAMEEVARQLAALQRTLVSVEQRAAFDKVVTAVETALEALR
jgi:hypothetical protein